MKRALIALAAAAAFLCAGAAYAAPPLDPGPVLEAPALVQDVASPANQQTCVLAIVEDRAHCVMTIAPVAGACPPELVPMLRAGGDRLLGSNAFLHACVGRTSPPPG